MLTILLIRGNQVVSVDQLVAELWGDNPPRRAVAAVHVYVSQLRKLIDQPGRRTSPIVTRPPGYLIELADGELDLTVFTQLIQKSRAHMRAERHQSVIDSMTAALRLWQAPVLGELRESPVIDRFVTWLEELHLEGMEMLMEANLRLDRNREVVSSLYELIQDHPLHQQFYRQLMVALHNSGRTGDALLIYRSARDTMTRELGLEPGRDLRDLQESLLSGNGRLDLRA